jgi:hypothetical protein
MSFTDIIILGFATKVKIRHKKKLKGCIKSEKKLQKKDRPFEKAGLCMYLKMFRLSLNCQRAGGYTFCSFNTYHVYTDGVIAGRQFKLLACSDFVNHQLA